jgi:DinB superfamily
MLDTGFLNGTLGIPGPDKGDFVMKKALAFCILAAVPLLAGEGAMSDSERSYLVDQLQQSKKYFLDTIAGVTDAQWKFKPSPTAWSIAECAEHIVLSEDFLFKTQQGILKTPVVPRPETSNSEADHKLVAAIGDRSHKATAPEPITPSGKFATPADAASAFTEKRDRNLAYAKTTTDDLRVHTVKGPIGTMDAYQFLLLMAAHTGRHTDQIKEVEANAEFPKAASAAR